MSALLSHTLPLMKGHTQSESLAELSSPVKIYTHNLLPHTALYLVCYMYDCSCTYTGKYIIMKKIFLGVKKYTYCACQALTFNL